MKLGYLIGGLVILSAVGGVFMWRWHGALGRATTALSSAAGQVAAAEAANAPGLSSEAAAAASSTAAQPFTKTYASAAFGFSFSYPDSLAVGTNEQDGATTILAQNTGDHVGFQIYITPWSDPDTSITAGRLAADMPGVEISDPQPVRLVSGGEGLAFSARDPNFGDSWQVWFVYQGNLYQISTYRPQQELLAKVLGTWNFSK